MMKLKLVALTLLLALVCTNAAAQPTTTLTVAQQIGDFQVFIGALQEGHAGLYYYIDPKTFAAKGDSIRQTFIENASVEDYYLKLRYLITLLCHGHTRINLPTNGWVNYKMGVLDSTRLYLPFEFLIVNKKLLIKEDCSKEQLFPRYSVVKSIGDVSAKDLIERMVQYIPADGVNQTFKYYNLYNYFYFHYLYNLFYPEKKAYKIELEKDRTHYYIQGLKPKEIDSMYTAKNKQGISTYGKQLAYNAAVCDNTAYLKVGSFYKGLIEGFGQKYEPFLDSTFADIKSKSIQNLIVDLRDNEGGGDGYDNILLAYLMDRNPNSRAVIQVPGRNFKYNKYAINLTDDIKGFIENPAEFLRDDTTLYLKDKYADIEGNIDAAKNRFTGRIIVLTNGGSFSASNAVIGHLYNYRKNTARPIFFVGEENGGDIYSGSACAGQGYTVKLPNSAIQVDMPFLCFGELKKDYPKKRLPDFVVYDKIDDLLKGKDTVLDFATRLSEER